MYTNSFAIVAEPTAGVHGFVSFARADMLVGSLREGRDRSRGGREIIRWRGGCVGVDTMIDNAGGQ